MVYIDLELAERVDRTVERGQRNKYISELVRADQDARDKEARRGR